jgi:Ni,Fe-hydrogenase III small subunit
VSPWVTRGLRRGVVTTRYPAKPDDYADSFPGTVLPSPGARYEPELARLCPTGALIDQDGTLAVDAGRCILCMRCVDARPDVVMVGGGSERSTLHREALVAPTRSETEREVQVLRANLQRRVKAFGRSLHVRHVDLGSDGADEWEVMALLNPYYDVQRLGIFFTASPKHADVLLLTGVGTRGMREPLRRVVEVMPRPFVVIAAGVDAASGGITAPTYNAAAGMPEFLASETPIDVWVPGSPPNPFMLMHGLLIAMGRFGSAGVGGVG